VVELAERNKLIREFEEGRLKEGELKTAMNRFPYQYYEYHEEAYWHAMPVDYPLISGTLSKEDWTAYEAVETLLRKNQFTEEGERDFVVYSLARLTPPEKVERLLPFMEEDHMWIPGHISNSLFLRRYDKAIPQIARVAVNGNHNCRQGAEMTLAKFVLAGIKGARQQAEDAYKTLGGNLESLRDTINSLQESPTLMYQ
jgi:hypothetical protein